LSTELLEDKQRFKLGGADTSPMYLLFQALLPLFWTLICMIWIKLTPDWRCFQQNYHGVVLCRNKISPNAQNFGRIFYWINKNSSESFRTFWELLFLYKNNTMAILLKTTLVRVSFIQIMQIRCQNKGKRAWKSRYVGDVSAPPSLNLCFSSSNSVDKLKVRKKNFYKLFCSCV
jgi:hypothetical protein